MTKTTGEKQGKAGFVLDEKHRFLLDQIRDHYAETHPYIPVNVARVDVVRYLIAQEHKKLFDDPSHHED